MANKRMFSKSITNSSRFLMMPASSQTLYFHLGMNADDDGFCEHFTIMRMTESKPDDLKILQAKEFITVFDDKILIIKDWKENNYLRGDRYTPSKYLDLYKNEIAKLSESGIPDVLPVVDERLPQYRLDKISKEKKSAKQICHNADALRLSHLLYERMKQNYYGTKEPNFNTWAIEVEKMINIDKRPIELISILF